MNPVTFNCTVLRDGHQSLAATRMKTEDMLPIAPILDSMGFSALETWGGATIDAGLRFLKEWPFDRLDALKKAAPKTPHMMLLRAGHQRARQVPQKEKSPHQPGLPGGGVRLFHPQRNHRIQNGKRHRLKKKPRQQQGNRPGKCTHHDKAGTIAPKPQQSTASSSGNKNRESIPAEQYINY